MGDSITRSGAIFVLGPSSSGKTTLCDALAAELDLRPPRYIKEVARNVMRTRGFTRDDTDTFDMQYAIMVGQLDAEEQVMTMSGRGSGVWLLSDRSAIDPVVYAGVSRVPGAEDRRARLLEDGRLNAILPFYRQSLFIVLPFVEDWVVDDGVRSLEEPDRYGRELVATLQELHIPHSEIPKDMRDLQERLRTVMALAGL